MRGTLTLLAHSLRRLRGLAAVLAVVLALFQVLLVRVARSLLESGGLGGLPAFVPPFVRHLAGDALLNFMSFAGIVSFGYFHPMVVAALGAVSVAVATEPAGELETRFLDLVLVRPVPRRAVVARSALLLLILPAAFLAAMAAGTATGLRFLAPPGVQLPDASLIASLALNLWSLQVCIGGLSLAVAAASRRRGVAGAIAGLALLSLFLTDYLARSWEPAKAVAWLSPFHYFSAMDLLLGRPLDLGHVAILLGGGAAGAAVAFAVFAKRDL